MQAVHIARQLRAPNCILKRRSSSEKPSAMASSDLELVISSKMGREKPFRTAMSVKSVT